MTVANGTAVLVERRRPMVVAAVLIALALVGVASVRVHPTATPSPSGRLAAMVDGLPGAVSSAWFCAGPLPTGTPGEASSLVIVNPGATTLRAAVTIIPVSGAVTTSKVAVPARSESVLGFARFRQTSFAAARVVVEGGGAEVVERVEGAAGLEVAPCAARATKTQYLATGGTRAGNDLAIALYDPGATPAVASMSFATPTGPQTPPALQGVLVPVGRVVALSIAHALPFRQFVSVTVTSSGGAVAAGALDIVGDRSANFDALEGPVDAAADRWFFAAAPAGAPVEQTFDLENPGRRTAEIEIRLGGPSGVGEITLPLGPGATTRYSPAADESKAAVRWASVTSMNGEPIVAARELAVPSVLRVAAPRGRSAAVRRSRALWSLPSFPVGFTVDPGATGPAKSWIVAGGESGPRLSELVTVSNPSPRPVSVGVRSLSGPLAGLGLFTVPAGGSVVVDLADLASASGRLPLRVMADEPVYVGGELYSRVALTSPGLAALAAFPVG
ncbi:MAG: DUF5719 family protein [Acidimicrobiales bacterium]|jgi:hypothetical protein